MMRKIIASIPNGITLLNLLSGLIAIIFAFHPVDVYAGIYGWGWTAIAIGAAAVFDFCDGFAARLLHAKSEIGKELDSLCDLVSFGVAPALLLVNVMLEGDNGWWSYAPLFIPLMGALRLAKFNIDDSQATTFRGLPIPANAIFWIGFVAMLYEGLFAPTLTLTMVIIAAIGLLMVCNMPMFSLKFSNLSLRDNFLRYLLIVAAAVFVITLGVAGLALTILLYIILSALQTIIKVEYK